MDGRVRRKSTLAPAPWPPSTLRCLPLLLTLRAEFPWPSCLSDMFFFFFLIRRTVVFFFFAILMEIY